VNRGDLRPRFPVWSLASDEVFSASPLDASVRGRSSRCGLHLTLNAGNWRCGQASRSAKCQVSAMASRPVADSTMTSCTAVYGEGAHVLACSLSGTWRPSLGRAQIWMIAGLPTLGHAC
jgi:hypothetical protein